MVGARGCDLKMNINMVAGLHVIITFLSQNERVEEQALLRTSRAGNRGTATMIFVSPFNSEKFEFNIECRNKLA